MVQATSEVKQKSKGTPDEDAKMRDYIKNKGVVTTTDVPNTYDYRVNGGI